MLPGSFKILLDSRCQDSNRKNTGPVAGMGATAIIKKHFNEMNSCICRNNNGLKRTGRR